MLCVCVYGVRVVSITQRDRIDEIHTPTHTHTTKAADRIYIFIFILYIHTNAHTPLLSHLLHHVALELVVHRLRHQGAVRAGALPRVLVRLGPIRREVEELCGWV